MAILKTLTVNGVTYNVVSRSTPSVTLPASAWVTNGKRHSQVVSIDGVTKCSQVDLTPDAEQLEVFHDKDLTFVAENEGGVVTVCAIGQKPENDYTFQVTLTEMKDQEGKKIVGNTVGTPLPKSDYTQTDPKKGDYLKGKDVLDAALKHMQDDIDELKNDDTPYVQTVNGETPDENGNVVVEIPEQVKELPEPTADDNGKALTVEDGKWTPGALSWNDLEDRPFCEVDAFEPIVWDGNTEGKETIDLSALFGAPDGTFVFSRIANVEASIEEYTGMTVACTHSGKTATTSEFNGVVYRHENDAIPPTVALFEYHTFIPDESHPENTEDFCFGYLLFAFHETNGGSPGVFCAQKRNIGRSPHEIVVFKKVAKTIDSKYLPDLAPKIVRGGHGEVLEPETFYELGEVGKLDVFLVEKNDGLAHEYMFMFTPLEGFAGLTITPEPTWIGGPQFPAGKRCVVSVRMGLARMLGGSGQTNVPDVSASDNGKFLQVVDGAWAAVSLVDVSEVGM